MPHWLQLMLDSLPTLLWAGVKFTIPLTLLSFAFGLSLASAAQIFAGHVQKRVGRLQDRNVDQPCAARSEPSMGSALQRLSAPCL